MAQVTRCDHFTSQPGRFDTIQEDRFTASQQVSPSKVRQGIYSLLSTPQHPLPGSLYRPTRLKADKIRYRSFLAHIQKSRRLTTNDAREGLRKNQRVVVCGSSRNTRLRSGLREKDVKWIVLTSEKQSGRDGQQRGATTLLHLIPPHRPQRYRKNLRGCSCGGALFSRAGSSTPRRPGIAAISCMCHD